MRSNNIGIPAPLNSREFEEATSGIPDRYCKGK